MRWIVLALMFATGMAHAQGGTSSPPSSQPPQVTQGSGPSAASDAAPRRTSRRRTVAQRFDEANTTHDGHLTAEQARAGMPAVARDFSAIDTGNRGYVTLEDIQAHNRSKRAARRAAKNAAPQ